MLEPFNALARRNAKPKDSILISKPSSPLIALPSALRNGHFFVALVALSAFLSEALNGLLGERPFQGWDNLHCFHRLDMAELFNHHSHASHTPYGDAPAVSPNCPGSRTPLLGSSATCQTHAC
jgi:hypothetical protein